MAKESLFNILINQVDLDGVEILDLFAGTGSISYEFLSRGASSATAVDNNPGCVNYIRKTAQKFSLTELFLIKANAYKFIKSSTGKWDIIFADPPYNQENIEEIYHIIFERSLLKEEGILIIEHSKLFDFSDLPGFYDTRNYSRVNFSFLRNFQVSKD